MSSISVEHKSYNRRIGWRCQRSAHFGHSRVHSPSHGKIKNLLCHLKKTFQQNRAAREDDATTDQFLQTGLFDVLLHQADYLFHAGLDNLTQNFLADGLRLAAADARYVERHILFDES